MEWLLRYIKVNDYNHSSLQRQWNLYWKWYLFSRTSKIFISTWPLHHHLWLQPSSWMAWPGPIISAFASLKVAFFYGLFWLFSSFKIALPISLRTQPHSSILYLTFTMSALASNVPVVSLFFCFCNKDIGQGGYPLVFVELLPHLGMQIYLSL